MKLAGMLLLLSGWGIVMSAVVLFPGHGIRGVFVLAGLAVQGIGLILALRGSVKFMQVAR